MELYNLSPAAGSTKGRFRKGRGHGSGNGKDWRAAVTKARRPAAAAVSASVFEGGQMPLAPPHPPAASPSAVSTTFLPSPWRSSTCPL